MGLSYLEPKDGPVVAGLEQQECVYAEHQPPYRPLRTLVRSDESGGVISRWAPTAEQRKAIADGADIYLEMLTFHYPLQPILMFLAGDEDAETLKVAFSPIVTRP